MSGHECPWTPVVSVVRLCGGTGVSGHTRPRTRLYPLRRAETVVSGFEYNRMCTTWLQFKSIVDALRHRRLDTDVWGTSVFAIRLCGGTTVVIPLVYVVYQLTHE